MKKVSILLLGLIVVIFPNLSAVTKQEFVREVLRQTGGPRPDEKIHFLDVVDELWGSHDDLPLKGGQLRVIILGVADIDWCAGLTVTNFCQRYLERVRGYVGIDVPVVRRQEQSFNDGACGICFGPYAWNARKFSLECWHAFHEGCLVRWLVAQRIGLCPLCRGPLTPGEKIVLRVCDPGLYTSLVREEAKQRWRAEQAEWQWLREEQRRWSEEAAQEENADVPVVAVDLHECDEPGDLGPLLEEADDDNENNNDEIM